MLFTLSGFVVTVLLVEEFLRSGTIDLPTFWKRRLLRLMPALVFVLTCLVLLGALVDTPILPAGQELRETPESGTTTTWLPFWPGIAVVFFPILNWVEALRYASFRPLAVAWMPAVLDQFYLVWPFVLSLLLVRRRLSLWACLVITLGLVGVATLWRTALVSIDNDFHAVTLRTDFNLAGIVLGCAGGLIFAAGMVPTDPRFRRVFGAAAWGSLVGILAIFAWGVQARADELVTLLGHVTVILVTDLAVDRTSRLSPSVTSRTGSICGTGSGCSTPWRRTAARRSAC